MSGPAKVVGCCVACGGTCFVPKHVAKEQFHPKGICEPCRRDELRGIREAPQVDYCPHGRLLRRETCPSCQSERSG